MDVGPAKRVVTKDQQNYKSILDKLVEPPAAEEAKLEDESKGPARVEEKQRMAEENKEVIERKLSKLIQRPRDSRSRDE